VIAIPASLVDEVVRLATDKVSRETHSREELQKGAYLRTVYDKYGVL
jgi:4-hydroxy-4-methyl-2-oxoglutarate aldolase